MSTKMLEKRINAGKFKGKSIKLPSKDSTRSSKSIVLGSLFDTLQFDIVDATFVELFAGSGSVGLEALSRGAKRVIFFEKDRDALRVLRSNIASLDPHSCEVIAGDSFINAPTLLAKLHSAYIYIDPPFSFRDGMSQIYEKMLLLIEKLPKQSVKQLIIEHMSSLEMPVSVGEFVQIKQKRFGATTLTYMEIRES
ncbi:MAG: 16S rRNA (guanine(966)-N(2))-methyltransferase RsmD [Sulfuricurvum sp.]